MKNIKLYNIVFPIWFLFLTPPFVIIPLVGNFLIDSLVVILCFFIFKLKEKGYTLGNFYGKSIVLVWVFGFISDFISDAIIIVGTQAGYLYGLPYDIDMALYTNVFDNIYALLIVIILMLFTGLLIFTFNYLIVFRKLIKEKVLRFKIALTIGIITIPWAFLVPSEIFFKYFGWA